MIIFSLFTLLALFAASYFYGYQKSQKFMRSEKLVSRSYYHGSYVLTHSLIFALIFILCWLFAKGYILQEFIMLKITPLCIVKQELRHYSLNNSKHYPLIKHDVNKVSLHLY